MSRRLLAFLGVPTAAICLAASPATGAGFGAHWALNESGTPSTAADSSGNGNTGTNKNIKGDGSGYVFNGVSSAVTVADSPSLDPGTNDFEFGVTVRTTLPKAGTDYDLLRKGLASTAGGEYKMEILNVNGVAKAMCLVKDAKSHVGRVQWAPSGGLNLAAQHTIVCRKTSTGVTLVLDGTSRTKTVSAGLGSVANDGPLFLGTRSKSGGDRFDGEMFDAHVS
jgi:hypothetical protein